MLSSEEAADKLGLNVNSMRVYAQKFGVGKKIAGRWFFTKRDLRILEERKTAMGRPRKRTFGG